MQCELIHFVLSALGSTTELGSHDHASPVLGFEYTLRKHSFPIVDGKTLVLIYNFRSLNSQNNTIQFSVSFITWVNISIYRRRSLFKVVSSVSGRSWVPAFTMLLRVRICNFIREIARSLSSGVDSTFPSTITRLFISTFLQVSVCYESSVSRDIFLILKILLIPWEIFYHN